MHREISTPKGLGIKAKLLTETGPKTEQKVNNRYYEHNRQATPSSTKHRDVVSSNYSDAHFDFDPKSIPLEGGSKDSKYKNNANTTLQLTHSERDIVGHQIYGGSDDLIEGG
jgi:hypothetical protein